MDQVHEQRAELLEILIEQVREIKLPNHAAIFRGPTTGYTRLEIEGTDIAAVGEWNFRSVMLCYEKYKQIMSYRERRKVEAA